MGAQNKIGLGRAGTPAAIDHVAGATVRAVIQALVPGRDIDGVERHRKALFFQHRGDELAVFPRLGIKAHRTNVFQWRQPIALGNPASVSSCWQRAGLNSG